MRVVPITLGVCLLWASMACAEVQTGRRPFSFGVVLGESAAGVDTVAIGDTLTLRISADASYAGMGTIRIQVPPELTILSGDTLVALQLREFNVPLMLLLTGNEPGVFEVRGIATFAERGSPAIDEAEFVVPVSVGASTIVAGPTEYLRAERVIDGKRFRYARGWLIPVEESESVIEAEFERNGTKPAILQTEPSLCLTCPAGDDTVMFVAVVSKTGKLVAARAVGLPDFKRMPEVTAIEAARATLERYKFRPAEFRRRPVTDWLYVRVPILRDPR